MFPVFNAAVALCVNGGLDCGFRRLVVRKWRIGGVVAGFWLFGFFMIVWRMGR